MEITDRLSLIDLAHVLFASPVQEQDRPTAAEVRDAIDRALCGCDGDCSACTGCVAQEAGDHPDSYQRRMQWALATVRLVYRPAMPLAS